MPGKALALFLPPSRGLPQQSPFTFLVLLFFCYHGHYHHYFVVAKRKHPI